jgi:hypothetical protein
MDLDLAIFGVFIKENWRFNHEGLREGTESAEGFVYLPLPAST